VQNDEIGFDSIFIWQKKEERRALYIKAVDGVLIVKRCEAMGVSVFCRTDVR
jgi:hypothetical protein